MKSEEGQILNHHAQRAGGIRKRIGISTRVNTSIRISISISFYFASRWFTLFGFALHC